MDHVQSELPYDVIIPGAIRKYVLVTKPGIIFGNLISVAGGFFLAARGQVDTLVLLATMIGVSLVVASACVFNNCFDRNMDRKMVRTRDRIMARGLMHPQSAVVYASFLGAVGIALLWTTTNLLCVAIVLTGFVIYAGIYSLYLKRRSVYATLIGSLAGAAPPLVGYCAVTGRFDMGALIILSIFSLWQIPHSYAIAIYRFQDYTAAAIPVLPLKQGIPTAKKHIFWYILAFIPVSLMLPLAGYTGVKYLVTATFMGLFWLRMSWMGFKTSDNRIWARKVFIFSILTITVLSVMMSIDVTIPDQQTNVSVIFKG